MTSPIGFDLEKLLEKLGYTPGANRKKPPDRFLIKGNMRDERTTAQLQEEKFSGMRSNELWMRFELWILGNVEATLSFTDFFDRPERLNEIYAQTFGIDPVWSEGFQKDITVLKERKAMLSDPKVEKAIDALSTDKKK